MSVYHELLEIKRFRETQAETEVRRHRALVAEANRAIEELEHKLADFRHWAENHERGLFDDLCARLVKLREIEELRETVAELRNRERNMEQGVLDAQGKRDQAARALDDAVSVHTDASRQTNKFKELSRVYSEEARLEQERLEDLEMEEFRSTRDEDDEWEAADDDTDPTLQ